VTAPPHANIDAGQMASLKSKDARMRPADELLELLARQAVLEKAMRQPGGARVTEEQELLAVKRKITSATGRPETAKSGCGIDG
jgi:hypothetical protein